MTRETDRRRAAGTLCLVCDGPEDTGIHDTTETCDELRGPCLDPGRHHPFRAAPVAEGLDAAWAAAEAALPEGWRLHLLEATPQDEWRVVAGKRIDDGTDPFIAIAEGPTPIAALLALVAKLEADR